MHLIKRRNFLGGLGLGAAAGLIGPLLGQSIRQAQGAGPDKRLLLMLGTYCFPDKYLPVRRAEADFDLGATMAPLAPYKDDLLLVTNFNVNGAIANAGHGHIGCDYLSGFKSKDFGGTTGPTFDRYLARKLGQNDRFASILLYDDDDGGGYETYDSADKPFPGIMSSVEAYERLFAQAVPGMTDDGAARALLARKQSILDFVVADVARVSGRLSAPEREKLDLYTESLRGIEKRLTAPAASGACTPPAKPPESLRKIPVVSNGAPQCIENAEHHVEIASLALACGLTHVAVVAFNGENVSSLGIKQLTDDGTLFEGIHGLNHLDHPGVGITQNWRMKQVARGVELLRGAGVGDASVVAYGDSNGTVHHQGDGDATMLLMVGRLGGAFKTGRWVQFERPSAGIKGPPRRYMNDLYVSLANALGVAVDSYGDASVCKGPMTELSG